MRLQGVLDCDPGLPVPHLADAGSERALGAEAWHELGLPG